MSHYREVENNIKIIDRTLPELCLDHGKVSRLDILNFCWLLKDFGVHLIEIDAAFLRKASKIPAGIDFLYRIRNDQDLEVFKENTIQQGIISKDDMKDQLTLEKLIALKKPITLEVRAESIADLIRLKDRVELANFQTVRILGLGQIQEFHWVSIVKEIQEVHQITVESCPENTSFQATALVVEALRNGLDRVTVTFSGTGKTGGYAALEEILMAYQLLINHKIKLNLSKFPSLCQLFKKITGTSLPSNKPILGTDLFKYESGIHIDGMMKNSKMYEPFEPCSVGQTRELLIGKHSGRKSLIAKFSELGIPYQHHELARILENVKSKSVALKRELWDTEIIEICQMI